MSIQNINYKVVIINSMLFFLPISFILGNLIINLNIILLIILSFSFFGLKIFERKFSLVDKLVILLFFYIISNGIFNNFLNFENSDLEKNNFLLTKSFAYSRFLILYFILKFLVNRDLIRFKFLFFSFGVCALFVSVDVIIQYFIGKDLFGYETTGRRLSGPFKDEYIAGSYIQRFFIFLPFAITIFFFKEKKIFFNLLIALILITSGLGAILAGNRMPLILFVLVLTIVLFYVKDFRKILVVSLFFILGGVYYLANNYAEFGHHYKSFVAKSFQITHYFKIKFTTGETDFLANPNIKEMETGILTWEQNKIFGGGIKSFYFNCSKIKNSVMDKYGGTNCSSHPHNYYLEIASELGILGLILIISIFFLIFIKTLKLLHFSKNNFLNKNLLIPFFALFIAEVFPFKSTGSFFTTANATFLFIIVSFIISLTEYKKNEKN
ncbi:O-antigen ligase family protein [Candidatus Pelagibacter bacterium]|nr:O-antigen ligase family protein [Candidatus Pelagibacter bacterium]